MNDQLLGYISSLKNRKTQNFARRYSEWKMQVSNAVPVSAFLSGSICPATERKVRLTVDDVMDHSNMPWQFVMAARCIQPASRRLYAFQYISWLIDLEIFRMTGREPASPGGPRRGHLSAADVEKVREELDAALQHNRYWQIIRNKAPTPVDRL
jgi:hypothetical protein